MSQPGARPPRSPLAGLLFIGLLLADGAFLWVVHQRSSTPEAARLHAWLAVLVPFFVPAYPALRKRLRVPEILAPLLHAVQLVVLLGLREAGPTGVALGALVLVQSHLWLRSRDNTAAGWCLAIAPLIVMLAMTLVPSVVWGALFPASLLVAAVSALALQDRVARRNEETSSVLRRFGASAYTTPDGRRPTIGWIAYALPLSIAVIGALTAIFLGAMAMPKPWQSLWELHPSPKPPKDWTNDFVEEPEQAQSAGEPFQQTFPSELNYSGGVSQIVQTRVMEVRPVGIGGQRGELPFLTPIYLRGRVMDTFTSDGAVFGAKLDLVLTGDARDGRADGWTQLEELAEWEQEVELAIRQEPLLAEGGAYGILFAPEPASAVKMGQVLWDRNGLLLTDEPPEDWFEYRVRFSDRRLAESRVRKTRAVFWDSRYVQLPPENEGYAWIAEQARAITRGAPNDFERVLRVVRYFKDNFDYSLKSTDFPGLRGVVDFMQGRRGHCTYFATAAVLMLRSLGIPCRVATGFITQKWSNKLSAYPITRKNGHAWIEVHFQGIGWVTMDPTPMDRRAAAFAALERRSQAGVGDWVAGVLDEFSQWASSGGDVIYFESFLDALADGPSALRRSLSESSAIAWGVLASFASITVLQLAWRFLRRRTRAGDERRKADPSMGAYARLLKELAKHGYHKAPTQTPREFAGAVARTGGESFQGLRPLTERFYRVRFGGAPWGEYEEDALEEFLEAIRS